MSRNQTPISPNAPLSFKTVPGRHRTQKWNKAPSYNYDGDDWGGYDPYDEYGGPEEEAPPPLPSQVPSGAPRGRKSSFDRGDDTRQFSAPAATSSFPAYDERRSAGPGSATSGGRGSNDFPRSTSRPRDFTNPEQVPPPLMTKATPPPPTWFPPRKSSLSGSEVASKAQADEARAIAADLSSANTDKPLPFIRPSDIYRRIPDEIRRQSEEGGRPSMESLQRESSPQKLGLEPVQESRESRLFMDDEVPKTDARAGNAPPDRVGSPSTRSQLPSLQTAMAPPPAKSSIPKEPSPTLPQLSRVSGFGDDFFLSGKRPTNSDPTSSESTPGVVNRPVVNTAGGSSSQTTFSSIQNTPTTSKAATGNGFSGQQDAPTDDVSTGLQHQPSQGFRSAVHQAFDRSDNSTPSRDSSQSGPGSSGVSRSDTNSTAGISPIMSRVPSGAAGQFGRQQRIDEQVPPIAEEPSSAAPTGSRPASGLQGQSRIPRKPSPGHSRNVSGEAAASTDFEPGYRRSLDPPSTGTSPARTPGMETTANKRLSTPMSAVHMTEAEAPDVADQAAEVPEPILEPAETPASEISQVAALGGSTVAAVASHTRGRSSTDYSLREADIAETVNSSPDKGIATPAIAEAQRDSQKLFLETHPGTPSSPMPPGTGFTGSGTPTRADSPAKGRVREIADRYHDLHDASRRNSANSIGSSKSSWSNFEAPRLNRQGTSQSQLGVDNAVVDDDVDGSKATRPELGREESFKPDLPGGWISSAPTPALESPPVQTQQITPRQSTAQEEVDLTPTTKKRQLPAVEPTSATSTHSDKNAFDAVKNAGDQLGASLLSTYGIGHQTRDFASSEPPAPINQPETQAKPERGSIAMQPPLLRHETDSTDAPTSVASSVAPTPPAKDTPKQSEHLAVDDGGGYFNTVAPLRLRSREPSPEQHTSLSPQRPTVMPMLSTDTGAGDMDSDRLRKEIVRSLDPIKKDELKRESIGEDAERTQDALNAPDNERRVEHGQTALPAAETAPSRLLTTKFSWERDDGSLAPTTGPVPSRATPEPEPQSPEIKPQMAYERPRTKALHVMNPGENVESPLTPADPVPILNEPSAAEDSTIPSPAVGSRDQSEAVVSPITKSQERLLPETNVQAGSPSQSLTNLAPSPISEHDGFNSRLPSYYLGAHDGEDDILPPPEKDHTTASSMSPVSTVQAKPAASIQPFRSILAMKSSDERIKTYNETRQTFADMNTGLNDWLSMMLEQHPEHANLSTSNSGFKPPALQSSGSGFGTFRRGHKASPSIAKFANKFGGDDKQRSTSVGSATESTEPTRPAAPGDGPRIDMDKMQQRGKNFMKQAGMFGGKAQEGAKGLFAKGKNRFGGGGGSVRGKPGNEVE
ncbi:hypothetical protein M409DRAFT_29349 [Zasmidium cellare ATCC 36951]|uniref:Uncharacterized protein n=1 Tax=Zasmidium cellare ATCC 36951 TaxID=1080233 RepID=A0A6A6C264_ZASCE|nr:uncharacterized protein M409DRAFT_29349 [Zasmidium cellare ATCC 36951]KAF2160260.1 hypothetical protein M409DRAFT_29349 [Zasmidium cellare ATCC 36951]